MLRVLKAFFPAVLLCYVLASIAATQTVLWHLAAMDVEIPLRVRLATTLHDLIGLTTTYLILVLLALLAGFAVVAGLIRAGMPGAGRLYPLAGFTAILALHLIMKAVFDISLLAATRTLPGLFLQCLSGAAGGWLFASLERR